MDGGFFLCPDAWEFLLPAGVRHLRNAMAVCRKRWDLLTLTPMGCALLPGRLFLFLFLGINPQFFC